MVPGLLLGGWLGSGVAVRIDGDVLRWIVAGYCLLAAAQLLLGAGRGAGARRRRRRRAAWPMTAAGTGIGAVSAVVGIGGGSMTVPLLVWRGVAPVRAVGTSSACGVAIGLASAPAMPCMRPPGALPRARRRLRLPARRHRRGGGLGAGRAVRHAAGAPAQREALKRVFAAFLVAVARRWPSAAEGAARQRLPTALPV